MIDYIVKKVKRGSHQVLVVVHDGEELFVRDEAKRQGVDPTTVRSRIKLNKMFSELFKPVKTPEAMDRRISGDFTEIYHSPHSNTPLGVSPVSVLLASDNSIFPAIRGNL